MFYFNNMQFDYFKLILKDMDYVCTRSKLVGFQWESNSLHSQQDSQTDHRHFLEHFDVLL